MATPFLFPGWHNEVFIIRIESFGWRTNDLIDALSAFADVPSDFLI